MILSHDPATVILSESVDLSMRTFDQKQEDEANYRQIIDAVARRDQVRMLVDGLTAANDLGLSTAVASHVVIHTDARRRAIQLDKLKIDFKYTAPSKLYWARRPTMPVVQALHWLKDTLPTTRWPVDYCRQ